MLVSSVLAVKRPVGVGLMFTVAWTVGASPTGRPLDSEEERDHMAGFGIASRDSASFTLWGKLDTASVPQLEVGILEAVKAGPLNFDLSDLTFMDSTGLNAFLRVAKALQSGCLILHGVQNEVRRVFDISGLQVLPNLHIIPCSLNRTP